MNEELISLRAAGDPLVSVIIPCFNRAQLVCESLESIRGQTYRPLELVVVDDGSTDDSVAVIQEWVEGLERTGEEDLFVQLLRVSNGGPSRARNIGFDASGGEFINFLDSDDLLHPHKILRQVAVLEQQAVDFCVCNYSRFSARPEEPSSVVSLSSQPHEVKTFPLVYPMNTSAPLYRASALAKTGAWNEGLRAGEDFEFNFRLVCQGAQGVWIDDVLLFVREHEGAERIQAGPLIGRYRDMFRGLAEMEMEARDQNLLDWELRSNLGMRSLMYYEAMRLQGAADRGRIFLDYARTRVSMFRRLLFFARHRAWKPLWERVYPEGPRALFSMLRRAWRR